MVRSLAGGIVRREYALVEIGALRDIGYINAFVPPGGEGEEVGVDYPPPVMHGAPVTGLMGLAFIFATCALGGVYFSRNRRIQI